MDHDAFDMHPSHMTVPINHPSLDHPSLKSINCSCLTQVLEAVNRLGPRVAFSVDPAAATAVKAVAVGCGKKANGSAAEALQQREPGRVPREEFVNQKLGSKLGQQLKDVLSICGGSMPTWVAELVGNCKFLFPFEIRRRCVGGED